MKKIFRSASTVLLSATLLLLLLLAYGSVDNRWYRVVTVEGNSMSPTLWFGDLIVVTPPPAGSPPVGTVALMRVNGSFVTHRIVGYDANGAPVTRGDANAVEDRFEKSSLQIVGICRLRLPGLGYPLLLLARLGSTLKGI